MKAIKGRAQTKRRRVWPQKKEKEHHVKDIKTVIGEIKTLWSKYLDVKTGHADSSSRSVSGRWRGKGGSGKGYRVTEAVFLATEVLLEARRF